MMNKVNIILEKLSNDLLLSYQYKGKSISVGEVFSPDGLFLLVLEKANKICHYVFEYKVNIETVNSQNSMTGKIAKIEDSIDSIFVLTMILFDILNNWAAESHDNIVNLDTCLGDHS